MFKFEIGSKVLFDGSQVAEIVAREQLGDINIYKISIAGSPHYASVTINENRLETALPGNLKRCECGADHLFGKYNTMHSDWCAKYVPHNSLR